MPKVVDIRHLETFFAEAEDVCIAVHTHPDGDALGSGVAMLEYLRRCRGKRATLLLPDPVAQYLRFLLPADGWLEASVAPQEAERAVAASDLVICLDMNGFSRAGCLEQALRGSRARKLLIGVDGHVVHPGLRSGHIVIHRLILRGNHDDGAHS